MRRSEKKIWYLVRILWAVCLFWIIVCAVVMAIHQWDYGDQTINTGGLLYGDNGEVVGMWDGHTGGTAWYWYVGTIIHAIVVAPPFPVWYLFIGLSVYVMFFERIGD